MKKLGTWVTALSLICFLAPLAFATGAEEPDKTAVTGPKKGGKVVISLNAEPTHLDNQLQTERNIDWSSKAMNGYLVRFDDNMELAPEVAESWEVLDSTTIRVKVRKGVKFHNGREVKAADAKASIERVLTDPGAASIKNNVKSIDRVEVNDDYTFTIYMKNPDATTLGGLAYVAIIPIEVVKEQGDLKTNPVGCGPFKFKSWERGSSHTMVRFDDYWEEGLPYLDELTFVYQPEYGAEIASLRSGDVDIVLWLNARDVVAWQKSPPAGTKLDDGGVSVMAVHYFSFNMKKEPWKSNEKLRQAVKYAIDRDECAAIALQGTGPAKVSAIGKASPYYNPEWEYDFDLEKAKQLMIEAGYPDGLTVDHIAPKTPLEEPLAQVFKQQLAKIGINLELRVMEVPTFIDVFVRSREYSTCTCGREAWNDPALVIEFFMHTDAPGNRFGFSDPQVDAWLEEARSTFDFDTRYELYDKVEKYRIERAAPYIVATNGTRFAGLTERTMGWKSQRDMRYDFKGIWVTD
jgi:peptide/nickel transport system substrate-binding protein